MFLLHVLHSLLNILLQVAEPTWVAALFTAAVTLLGIPTLQSAVTGFFRRFTDKTGLKPETLVWVVGGVFATIGLYAAKTLLPVFSIDNPPEYIEAWCALIMLWTKTAQYYYDKALSSLPVFAPPQPT